MLFYNSVSPKQILFSSQLEADQRLLLAGVLSVQARILEAVYPPVEAQMGNVFWGFGEGREGRRGSLVTFVGYHIKLFQ